MCCSGGLQVTCTANQDTPLPLWPLFNVDLWEHAFIPDYENRREDYVEAAEIALPDPHEQPDTEPEQSPGQEEAVDLNDL